MVTRLVLLVEATSNAVRRNSSDTPPEINVETLARIWGVAIPPGDAMYFGNHSGPNLLL